MTPLEYVIQHEGTYNPEKRLFACTECYVLLGCPSGAAPGEQWKAGNKIQAKRDLDKWADAYRCKRW
jgi:hypothetical protein